MKTKNIIFIAIRIAVAIILLQTLFFKFTGHEESVVLFTKLGVEPVGRIATGIIELIASLLILWRRTTWVGALLGVGLMIGAVASHLLVIGIESAGDGGQLFGMAWLVLVLCIVLLYAYRNDWIFWKKYGPLFNS